MIAGRYRLVSELGRGSMGVVYEAVQEPMNRGVALKMLLPHAASHPRLIGRFKREVQVISQLRHPNTVTIFDYGDLDDGSLYFAMELLQGRSLGSTLRRGGPMPPERVRYICRQILKSLSEAHDKGIIHRDLKPDNIFLEEIAGEADFVKVLDFSIAKALRPAEDTKDLTGAGVTVGTPVYMAPEQFNHEEVNAATDLYALGHMMYEMLGGKPVFQGASWIEIALHKMDDRPVKLRDDIVCSDLGGVIVKAIKQENGERYQSAADMLADLNAVGDLSGQPALKSARQLTSMKADTNQLVVQTPFGPRAVTSSAYVLPEHSAAAQSEPPAIPPPVPVMTSPGAPEPVTSPDVAAHQGAGHVFSIEQELVEPFPSSVDLLADVSIDTMMPSAEDVRPEGRSSSSLIEMPALNLPDEEMEMEATAISSLPEFEPPPLDPMASESTRVEPERAMLTPHPVHQQRAPVPNPVEGSLPPVEPPMSMDPEARNILVIGMIGAGVMLLITAIVLVVTVLYVGV